MTTGVYLGTFEQDSPEWHAVRATGVASSDIAALLGLSPWDSPFSLWHRKRGLVAIDAGNRDTDRGHRLEDAVGRWFVDQHPGVRLRRTGTWRHRDRVWQLANPDRFATGRRVVELKTDRHTDGWGAPGSDEIPVYYRAQVLWQLDTLGWDTAHVAVLTGQLEFREYVIRHSEEDCAFMRDRAEAFWRTVLDDVRPPLDGHDATYQIVRELHPDIDGLDVEIPAELAGRYRAACAAEHAATETKQAAAAEVLDAMGSARRAVCAGDTVALRIPGRNGGTPFLRPAPPKKTPGQKVRAA